MSQLSDVPEKDFEELAGYLKRFPVGDDDAEQFWYQLACVLRKKYKKRFNYTEQVSAVGPWPYILAPSYGVLAASSDYWSEGRQSSSDFSEGSEEERH